MDPLSALGVAAAAVGFFDCAVGLSKMYRQIRDRGDPDLLRTIRTTASDLAAARKSLIQRPSNPALSLEVSENEQVRCVRWSLRSRLMKSLFDITGSR